MWVDGAHPELRTDEQRPLAHAPDPARVVCDFWGQADAVVAHGQNDAAIVVRLEGDHDLASLRVAHDVGEALLGDAVDDQLLLGGEREVAGEPSLDLEPRPLGDRRAKGQQRALEPELVERLGAESAGDQPDLFRRLTRSFAEPDDVFADFLGSAPRERLATQDQPRQELADLVVQLPRDAPPLGFLGGQSAAPAVAPLALEAVEHRIECFSQRDDLLVAGGGVDPLSRGERVDLVHDVGQGLQRRQCSSEEGVEEHQRHGEAAQDHRQLRERRRHRHRDRRQHQPGDGEADHRHVGEEQPAEQGRTARTTHATRLTLGDGWCGAVDGRSRLSESLQAYADVFRNPQLRRIELALVGSITGDWAYAIALSVFAYEHGGTAAVGLVALLRFWPSAAAAPFLSILGDRYRRERVMVTCDLLRALAIGGAAATALLDGPPLLAIGLAVSVQLIATAFRPAQAALLPSLATRPEELTAANVASSSIESVGSFAGPALGGLLLALTSTGVVFASTSLAFLWSALMVSRIRGGARPERSESGGLRHELLAGVRAIGSESRLRLLVGLYGAQTLVAGALNVLIVVTSLRVLDEGRAGVGYLNAAVGVGGVIGAGAAIALVGRKRLASDFGLGLVSGGFRSRSSACGRRPRSPCSCSASSGSGTRSWTSPA